MADVRNRVSFETFSDNLAQIFERVIREGEEIIVETEDGSRVALTLLSRTKTEADYEAFRSAAGSWSDVDTDTLLKNIYERRGRSC